MMEMEYYNKAPFTAPDVPTGLVDVVLDTDAYNEVDDQFAIAYLLHAPERVRLRGICAAPFYNTKSTSPADGMEKSYQEIQHILSLAGFETLGSQVYRGSAAYLPDEETPVSSPAAHFLVACSKQYTPEKPLYIVAIGAITNVASALLLDPTMRNRVVVVWLGGNALYTHCAEEFNMMQDIAAARVLFGCGVPLVMVPCGGVVDHFTISGPELEFWLRGKNQLCDYLASHTIEEAERYAKGKPWTRVIWDVTAAAWLLNDNGRFLSSELQHSPIPEYDLRYGYDYRRHLIRYVSGVRRDALMEDLIRRLTQQA